MFENTMKHLNILGQFVLIFLSISLQHLNLSRGEETEDSEVDNYRDNERLLNEEPIRNVVENIAECETLATAEQSTKCREQGDKRDKDNRLKKIEEIRKTECRKVNMHVTLKSWSGWDPNLNPKTFPRNYCVGECSYPDSHSSVEFTNHAIIRSIMREEKIRRVPKPCCVPNKFADLHLYSSVGNRTKVHVKKYFTIMGCSCQ